MSAPSVSRTIISHREGTTLPLIRKRTRSNKLRHKEILGAVPIEIVPAWDERRSIRYGGIDKRTDPIGNLLLKYEFTPQTELVEAVCRACAQEQFDETVWETIRGRIEDLVECLNAVDSGLVIKTTMIYTKQNPQEAHKFAPLVFKLLRKLVSRRQSPEAVGTYTLLYGLQSLNHFNGFMDAEKTIRYFTHILRRLARCERCTAMHTTALINTIQAVVNRPTHVIISRSSIDPILDEILLRVSQIGPADTPEKDPPDADGLFGLLSAVSKLLPYSSKCGQILTACKISLFANDNLYLNLLTFEQLIGTAHAYSRLGPATLHHHTDVFKAIGNVLSGEDSSTKWTPRTLATIVNAYGTAAVLHSDLFAALKKSREVTESFEPMQTSMFINGLGKLGILKKFPHIIPLAIQQVTQMDLHSFAKILNTIKDEDSIKEKDREQLLAALFYRANEICDTSFPPSQISSLVVILHFAVANTHDEEVRRFVEKAIPLVTENISHCDDLGRLCSLIHSASMTQAFSGASTSLLADQLVDYIYGTEHYYTLPFPDLVKLIYGTSVLRESKGRDKLLEIVKNRAKEIVSLSRRNLSLLTAGLNRLGCSDVDLIDAIKETSLNSR